MDFSSSGRARASAPAFPSSLPGGGLNERPVVSCLHFIEKECCPFLSRRALDVTKSTPKRSPEAETTRPIAK